MIFRRNSPGLVGRAAKTAARTALITATATTVANKTGRKVSTDTAVDPTSAVPAQPGKIGGLSDDAIAKLEKLAEMRKSGILTDAEFAEQKARLLA